MLRVLALLLLPIVALAQVQTSAGIGALYPAGAVAAGGRDANGLLQPLPVDALSGGSVSTPSISTRAAFGATRVAVEYVIASILFPYSVNPYLVNATTSSGGTVTQNTGKAVLQTSTAATGTAQIESKRRARYIPGQGMIARFTGVFSPCVAGSTQEIGIGDTMDGFFFGCFGGVFGVDRRQNGTDNVTAQTGWNGDPMNGLGASGQTLNISNGNVFAIQYQWLGFGMIRFFIEDQTSGQLVEVHQIEYANSATAPSILNPTLPLHARVTNSGNVTNLTLQTASMGVAAEGPPNPEIGARHATTNSKTSIPTTGLSIFALQNVTTFNGYANRTVMYVDNVSIRVAGSADGWFALVRNPTLGGTPSFVPIDATGSIAAVDTAGTTVSGGQVLFVFSGSGTGNIDLSTYDIHLNPGDTLACVGHSESTTVTARCSVGWVEDF